MVTRVGVLSLQGDVAEHEEAVRRCGAEPRRVRRSGELEGLAALIVPGGESTTIGKMASDYGLIDPLRSFVASGRPVMGTCAGLILLADDADHPQPLVGGLDAKVRRNAFGRQVDSFELDLAIEGIGPPTFRAVFIRSPAITCVGPRASVIARLEDGTIVGVRQDNVIGVSFHPELTDDIRLHRLLLTAAKGLVGQRYLIANGRYTARCGSGV
jgi:5'-phosphate synthase pdxT subunit